MFYCMFYFTRDRSLILTRTRKHSKYEKLNFYCTDNSKANPIIIITSAKGGYVFTSVCLSVCLSVRRITEKVVNGF